MGARQITDSLGLDLYPTFSPDGAQIAYCSDRGGGFEIYVRQLIAGGREIQITSDGQDSLQPAWSRDGREIAFTSRGRPGIWLVPALGGTPRRLTEFGSRPAWSPDGTTLVFQSSGPTDTSASVSSAASYSSIATQAAAFPPRREPTLRPQPRGHEEACVPAPGSRHVREM